jgi:hypothetical protein
LRRARRLNPLSEHADLTAGSIALRRRDWSGMAAAYEAALERNPHSWYAHLQLALAELQRGRRPAAAAELRAADTLNPTEPVIDLVDDAVARGERVDPDEVARILLERHEQVTGGEPTRKPSRRMSLGGWPNGYTSTTVWRGRRCSTSSAQSMGPCGEGELS